MVLQAKQANLAVYNLQCHMLYLKHLHIRTVCTDLHKIQITKSLYLVSLNCVQITLQSRFFLICFCFFAQNDNIILNLLQKKIDN